MNNLELTVELRENVRKSANSFYRKNGKIPGILYGKNFNPVNLNVNSKALSDLQKNKKFKTSLISIKSENPLLDGKLAMLKSLQVHPISSKIFHADFLAIDMNVPVTLNIPLVIEGKSIGVANGGILVISKREINIKCLPGKIPDNIKVDITNVGINQSIHISDLKVDENFQIMDNPKDIILNVVTFIEEKEKKVEVTEEGAAVLAASAETTKDSGKEKSAE